MATTASGIRYPLGSDTVNIAVDAQNLATDIDTKLLAQTYGLSSQGDILGYSGTANAVIPVNTRPGYVLEADSTATAGVKWSAGHFPNMFFIASSIATSGSQPVLSFTNIPQIFQAIKLYVYCKVGTSNEEVRLISMNGVNVSSTSSQEWNSLRYSFSNDTTTAVSEDLSATFALVQNELSNPSWAELTIHDYADQNRLMKPFTLKSVYPRATTNNPIGKYESGFISLNSTTLSSDISSLSLQWGSTNAVDRWAAYLYGVK
jgi:hypothetical protein